MEERKYFTFLKSYADIYQQLNNNQKIAFIDAIIEHQLGDLNVDDVDFDDVLLNVAWSGIKHSLGRSKAQYLNGKKPKLSQTKAKTKPKLSQIEAKPEQIRNKKKEIRTKNTFIKPTIEEITKYCNDRNNGINPDEFFHHYEANNWYRGKTKISRWKSCMTQWEINKKKQSNAYNGSDDQYAGGI